MSERRSTEIKFRTTPSFKARVQAAAAAADKSMSEYIEECAETRMWADANQNLGVYKPEGDAVRVGHVNVPGAPHYVFVDTSGDSSARAEEPKGWMFEARQ